MDRKLPFLLTGRQPPQENKKVLPPPPTYATTTMPRPVLGRNGRGQRK